MALSAFDDKAHPPQEKDLAKTLGSKFALWNDLKDRIAARFAPLSIDWGFASKNTGWGLRLKQEKRTVLYMTPCQGYFLVSFALGEKAVKAAHASDLPAAVLDVIDKAPKYAEGRGVRFEVKSAKDVRNLEKVAIIKMAN
ncbi:hypothetical protein TFLX_05294 [Thermoflexales bacterium]|nr:hypothetical protein TFLX_05294 [Thermoflexales bacterium]